MSNSYKTDGREELQGSFSLDVFRRVHKKADRSFWSSDLDFVWIEKNPYRIIGILELKNKDTDGGFTFAESVLFNVLLAKGLPVYYVSFRINGQNITDIDVMEIVEIDPRPNPPVWLGFDILNGVDWGQFLEWERHIRRQSKVRN